MSGGSLDILRKMTARYTDIHNETRWIPPVVTLIRKVEYMILYVSGSSPNSVCHRPVVSLDSLYCTCDIKAVKTKKGIRPASRIAAKSI